MKTHNIYEINTSEEFENILMKVKDNGNLLIYILFHM